MDLPGATVREVLDKAFASSPELRSYLLDDQGRVRRHVAIFVNGETIGDRAGLSDPVAPDAEVFVMQALSGGST
jgi:sulfur-carrier protein